MSKYILSAFADEAAADLEGQIAALVRNGIGYIEIRNVGAECVITPEIAKIKEIAARLKDSGIGVSAIGSPIGKIMITDDFAPHLELYKKTLETADILGTNRIRMFSFFMPKGQDAAQYKTQVFERIEELLDLAEGTGIYCCLENEKDLYGENAERSLELLSAFKGRLRGVFDPANYIQCGEIPTDIFGGLAEYTDYLHIKDALADSGGIRPAGEGDGGIEEILTRFYERADRTFLTLEPHLAIFPGFGNLADDTTLDSGTYRTTDEAFDTAAEYFIKILNKRGFSYE
ncbi:MAG: sugar phosphate isomerase/epimerase [Oscillospiraceae bacterium]|nr:sugar phosphate isomerase/epimerase [Oscillospiraceae bacterium]